MSCTCSEAGRPVVAMVATMQVTIKRDQTSRSLGCRNRVGRDQELDDGEHEVAVQRRSSGVVESLASVCLRGKIVKRRFKEEEQSSRPAQARTV